MLSLMGGYLASCADKTLVATGDLETMAPQRLAETVLAGCRRHRAECLGALRPGFANTMRVAPDARHGPRRNEPAPRLGFRGLGLLR